MGRISIDGQFHGGLDATSKGEVLSAMTAAKGSAGYEAIEEVSGTLQGTKGTCVLHHSATMARGVPALSIIVVPDPGAKEMIGLPGTMGIDCFGKEHYYDFTLDTSDELAANNAIGMCRGKD
jgi:hypothetical protein